MSLNLNLLPFNSNSPSNMFSHTVLPLDLTLSLTCSTSLRDQLRDLDGVVIEDEFNSHCGSHSGFSEDEETECQESGYGPTTSVIPDEELTFVTASQLVAIDDPDIQGITLHRAAWAYLAALPPETKVALYWH